MAETTSAPSGPSQATAGTVSRRTVFYISGFDPRGPVHYHGLYRSEGSKQAAVNGLSPTVSKRQTVDAVEARWTVEATGVETGYRFLRYEDIIRAQWPRNGLAMYGAVARYSWHFLRMGVFRMIHRNSWPSFVAVTYPGLLIAGLYLAALITGVLVALIAGIFVGEIAWLLVPPALVLPLLPYRFIEKKYNAFWLARSCAFLVDRSLGRVPGIEERCAEFAKRVAEAVNAGESDEVLIAAHSVGTHLAVTVAARALEQIGPDKRFSLLTLAQAIAMTPSEDAAEQFRRDLLAISVSEQIDWIDVTSAVDGSCIPLTDPLSASNVTRPQGARVQPKLVSARFNKQFSPETYATIRRDFMRTHFQYLMSGEIAGDYDFFLITAGPLTLAERFAHLESVTDFNRFRKVPA